MARYLETVATVRPGRILADAYMRDTDAPDGYALMFDVDDELDLLRWNIANAVIAQLPADLFAYRRHSEQRDVGFVWDICAALDKPAPGSGIAPDSELRPHLAATEWLSDGRQVAERIDLDALTREAIRRAQLQAQV